MRTTIVRWVKEKHFVGTDSTNSVYQFMLPGKLKKVFRKLSRMYGTILFLNSLNPILKQVNIFKNKLIKRMKIKNYLII